MHKYIGKGFNKAISVLLSAAMILAAPIGAAQVFAQENEQPTVTTVQGEESKSDMVLDSGILSENLASPMGIAAESPEFAEGYPQEWETTHNGSKYVKMIIKPVAGPVTAHYIAVANGAVKPTKEQVKAAKDGNDNAPLRFYSVAEIQPNGYSLAIGPLPDSDTAYDIWVVLENAEGTLSEPKLVTLRTPPKFSLEEYPKAGAVQIAGSKQVQMLTSTTFSDVTAYYVAVADGATTPVFWQVYQGFDGDSTVNINNPALSSGSIALQADTLSRTTITLPTDSTNYDVYMVIRKLYHGGGFIEDLQSDVVKLDVATPAASRIFEVSTLAELQNTLGSKVIDGDTIKLTADIIYNENTVAANAVITIKGRNITLDMNGHNLTIGNTGLGMGMRLEKPESNERNATQLHVIGSGNLRISSVGHGLSIDSSKFTSSSTVNVEIYSASGSGIGGTLAEVDIQNGSVTGNHGIYVSRNSIITVNGPIKATTGTGVKLAPSKLYAEDIGCVVNVGSVESVSCGVSLDGGNVTIDGTLTAPSYIQFNEEPFMGISDYLDTTTKVGYRTYHHATAGTVWVKGDALPSTINVSTAEELTAALTNVTSGGTIKLLKNINYNSGIYIMDKTIYFDLNGFTLNVTNNDNSDNFGIGLRVERGTVIATGSGAMNVTGIDQGVVAGEQVLNPANPIIVDITSATAINGSGVSAYGTGTNVTVRGNVKGSHGIYAALGGGKIDVYGNILAERVGVEVLGSKDVHIKGNVTTTGDNGNGAKINGDGTITVDGSITTTGIGAQTADNGKIIVGGNVNVSGAEGVGAYVFYSGSITINGTLTAEKYIRLLNSADAIKQKSDGVKDNAKAGYLKYADGNNCVVWVADTIIIPDNPPAPSTPGGSSYSPPQPSVINGAGWNAVNSAISKAASGSDVAINMNGATQVPKSILDAVKGKDINLVITMSNGFVWTINGKDITETKDIDLTVKKPLTQRIPIEVLNTATGEKLQLYLEFKGDFGFKAILTVPLGSTNSGRYANLFYFNPTTQKLEYISSGKIGSDGKAGLDFTHASDYVVTITNEIVTSANPSQPDDIDSTGQSQNPQTGNSSAALAIIVLAGATILFRNRKKAK